MTVELIPREKLDNMEINVLINIMWDAVYASNVVMFCRIVDSIIGQCVPGYRALLASGEEQESILLDVPPKIRAALVTAAEMVSAPVIS